MIVGSVTSSREAVVRLTVRGPTGEGQAIDAIIDTGFNFFLTLPSDVIAELNSTRRSTARVILADGSETRANVYAATAIWDDRPIRIPVQEANTTPLVGMALLEGYELRMQCVEGGRVVIEAFAAKTGA